MDGNPKQQLVERLKQANNVLVTVSSNPSVDQLASCIGLTLVLNHMGKHATAVFSGEVPSTIEFLKPEKTLEKNTDSLRDFIIALDKSKADKLRYKVEDQVVRIFITPYRTSISEKDLDFSQGDFNVDVVVALGVHEQNDLDQAITAHGRILHDAAVASINIAAGNQLGSINWTDAGASSLSELVVVLADALDKSAIDNQTATALLTGIVAATNRFSNDKTSPQAMSASAELMAAGANQQLIATKLETQEPAKPAQPPAAVAAAEQGGQEPAEPKKEPGELEIEHEGDKPAAQTPPPEPPKQPEPEPEQPQVHIDEHGNFRSLDSEAPAASDISKVRGVSAEGETTESSPEEKKPSIQPPSHQTGRERVDTPPRNGGKLTASADDDDVEPPTENLTLPPVDTPFLSHDSGNNRPADAPAPTPPAPPNSNDRPEPDFTPSETLTEIEEAVDSPHLAGLSTADTAAPNVDDARSAVEAALNAGVQPPEKPADFNSLPLGPDLHSDSSPTSPSAPAPTPAPNPGFSESTPGNTPADAAMNFPTPSAVPPPIGHPQPPSVFPGAAPTSEPNEDEPGTPPVPPPFVPPRQ